MIFQVWPLECCIATINAPPGPGPGPDGEHVQPGRVYRGTRPSPTGLKHLPHLVRLNPGERVDGPLVPLIRHTESVLRTCYVMNEAAVQVPEAM
jgi:hypothetical protein